MQLSRALDHVLGSRSKISALRVLFSGDELSGREIARRAALSPRAASLALADLVRAGVLRRRPVGSVHQFAVNRKRHLVRAALERLFQEERRLPDTMGRRIARALRRHRCLSVAIFGSFARGQAGLQSDLDVLVVLRDSRDAPRVKDALRKEEPEFHDLFGLTLSPYIIGAAEFADRLKRGDRLIKSMVREARVMSGTPLSEVLLE